MSRINLKAWGLMGLSLALAAYAFGLVFEGFIADHYSGLFSFPLVDEPAAWRAYRSLPPNAPIAVREVAARRLIRADPTNADSWCAISYVEFLKAGRMSPQAVEALDHSYAVSFFDRQGAVWRVGFAFENWAALPLELRKDVLAEAAVALRDPTLGPQLRTRLQSVESPAGRLAAILVVAQAQASASAGQ